MTLPMTLPEWLAEKRGRCALLAVRLRVRPAFVSKLKSGKCPVPIRHVGEIEQLTAGKVTRQALRPDDWHLIWPELAEKKGRIV